MIDNLLTLKEGTVTNKYTHTLYFMFSTQVILMLVKNSCIPLSIVVCLHVHIVGFCYVLYVGEYLTGKICVQPLVMVMVLY